MHHCHARHSRLDFACYDIDNLLHLNSQAIRELDIISIADEHVRGQRVYYQLHVFALVPALHRLHGHKQPNIYEPHGCHVDAEKADGAHATQHEVGMKCTQRARTTRTRTGHDSIGHFAHMCTSK